MKNSEKLVAMKTNRERAEFIYSKYFIRDESEMKEFENWLNKECDDKK